MLSLLLITVVTVALAVVSVVGIGTDKKFSAGNIKRGLDLEGGLSITYQTLKEDPTVEEMSDTRYKLQLRVDNYSTEAAVYQEAITQWKPFFRQRVRWAIGNFETLFIYLPQILRSKVSIPKKFGIIEHISFYSFNLLIFFGFIITIANAITTDVIFFSVFVFLIN